jgi:hypothetical protein
MSGHRWMLGGPSPRTCLTCGSLPVQPHPPRHVRQSQELAIIRQSRGTRRLLRLLLLLFRAQRLGLLAACTAPQDVTHKQTSCDSVTLTAMTTESSL